MILANITKYIGIVLFDTTTIVETLDELQTKLQRACPYNLRNFDHARTRMELDNKLAPWVMANLSSFPELYAEPVLFVHTMPVSVASQYVLSAHTSCYQYLHAVLDLICDPQATLARHESSEARDQMFAALKRRGVSPVCYCTF